MLIINQISILDWISSTLETSKSIVNFSTVYFDQIVDLLGYTTHSLLNGSHHLE